MVRGDHEEGEEEMMVAATKPAWLEGLMSETFFSSCGIHGSRRKSEKNVFCLLCCLSVCPHCLPSHRSHPLLQQLSTVKQETKEIDFVAKTRNQNEKHHLFHSLMKLQMLKELKSSMKLSSVWFKHKLNNVRRYVYHDVVRLSDLEKLIDCSYIQPYTNNGARVIFINQRPQSRVKVSSNVCFTCDRILQEPFHFCSLSCKVDYLVYQGDDLSSILYRIDESDFTFLSLRMDGHDQLGEISTMEDETDDIVVISDQSEQGNNSNKEKRKKKKESNYLPGMVLSVGSRRKGAPHRAPFS
ncbi:hypothetical protein HID58_034449 [Brassica napus]|uniref:B box-type domain-containing protein n=1 Tax=Brassica napus TaxID=3708 RepID=A0ABQ8C273_BRANA|nr:hypothetical protein HID58_034449 [Brassica napus]